MLTRHHSFGGTDLLGARHHHDWHCHTNRIRRNGRNGRSIACLAKKSQHPQSKGIGAGSLSKHHAHYRHGGFYSDWLYLFFCGFQGVDGGRWVEDLFSSLPGGWVGFLIVVNLFVFFLAFFLDFFEIAFIVVPMLAPVAVKLLSPVLLESMNNNPQAAASAALVWFGVMLCVNMQPHLCIRPLALPCST